MEAFELLLNRLKEYEEQYLEERKALIEESKRNFLDRSNLSDLVFKGKRLEEQALVSPRDEFTTELSFFKKVKPREFEKFIMSISQEKLDLEERPNNVFLLILKKVESWSDKAQRLEEKLERLNLKLKKEKNRLVSESKKLSLEAYKEFHQIVDELSKRLNLENRKTIDDWRNNKR